MIKLGQKGRDKITGFEGIIIGHSSWLYGCDTYGLMPPAKDGKTGEVYWIDAGRVEIIGEGIPAENVQVEAPGGDQRDIPTPGDRLRKY